MCSEVRSCVYDIIPTILMHTCICCRKFETEAVAMTANMLHGNSEVVGNLTSGGTESILMAVKTYRDRAKSLFPHIAEPEMVGSCVAGCISHGTCCRVWCVCVCACVRACVHACVHVCVCVYVGGWVGVHTCVCAYACICDVYVLFMRVTLATCM